MARRTRSSERLCPLDRVALLRAPDPMVVPRASEDLPHPPRPRHSARHPLSPRSGRPALQRFRVLAVDSEKKGPSVRHRTHLREHQRNEPGTPPVVTIGERRTLEGKRSPPVGQRSIARGSLPSGPIRWFQRRPDNPERVPVLEQATLVPRVRATHHRARRAT